DEGAQGDPADLEAVGEGEGDVADAGDQSGGDRHQHQRVGEVDPVLHPDLRAEQADHAVQDDGDAADHPLGDGVDQRTELGAQADEDRHARGHVVGGGGVDAGDGHDADVLGVGGAERSADGGATYRGHV